MPQVKNYVYTDLSTKNSLFLVVGDTTYDVVQYSSSWAANEIPSAVVMLAVGRDARRPAGPSEPRNIRDIKQMTPARIWFEPSGEYSRTADWPGGRRVIFEGFFVGFAYRKIAGKIHVVAHLSHWLAALGCSSALSGSGHVANPAALNADAVIRGLAKATVTGQGNYVSDLVSAQVCAPFIATDLWAGIKTIFCKLAGTPTMVTGPANECGGTEAYRANDFALSALKRIEGPGEGADLAYAYGRPLALDTLGQPQVESSISHAIGQQGVSSYSATTFWDKLVSEFCPMFGMAVVPAVNTATVVADVPAFNAGYWKEIQVEDYDSLDLGKELHRPLRGVGVVATYENQTGSANAKLPEFLSIGGCHVEQSVTPGDGAMLFVAAPPWLQKVYVQPGTAAETLGQGGRPSPTATNPLAAVAGAVTAGAQFNATVSTLYGRYAHDVYVQNMLRGQSGVVSGKLRFDVAPLSIVKVVCGGEVFADIANASSLETPFYGCVQRVTVSINAEAGMAGTTMTLTHVRSEEEYADPRTGVAQHPLFTASSIHGRAGAPGPAGRHGSPLVPEYDL